MRGTVWASGFIFSPEQADTFALFQGHSKTDIWQRGVPTLLNEHFVTNGWNTSCVPVWRDGRHGLLVITNFAVVRAGAGAQQVPRLAGDAWSRAVRAALLTPELKETYPMMFDWVDSGRFQLHNAQVPHFVISLFNKQRKGLRVTSISPDQTDYSQWRTPPKKASTSASSASSSASTSANSSSESSSVSSASSSSSTTSPATPLSTPRRRATSSDSDCDTRPCPQALDPDLNMPMPRPSAEMSSQSSPMRNKPVRRNRPRRRRDAANNGGGHDHGHSHGHDCGHGDDGYDADAGYESTDTVRG